MALISSFNEDRPVSYFRGYPIYYATLLTIAYLVGIVLTALCQATGISLEPFVFAPHRSLFGGQIWQLVTCTFINEPSFFSIFFLLFLYVSAVEVEKYLGMRRFLTLYGLLLATPLVVLTAWMAGFGPSYAYMGNTEVAIGFFLAFCALYPNVQWWGVLPLKWVGIGSFIIALLTYLSRSQWTAICLLCAVGGVTFGYIRALQSGLSLPRLPRLFARKARPKLHVVNKQPSPARPASSPKQPVETTAVEIDELLDKISKKGLGSLTAQERAALERAREKLLEKDKK
jgi:membrane associated rhomboid family serine protease